MSQVLHLPLSARAAVRAAAAAAHPSECCGALAGLRRADGSVAVAFVLEAANEALEPAHRFHMGPTALRALEARAEAMGAALVGFYHSHPGGAVPSASDAAAAFPGVVHLIAGHRGEELRAWELLEDRSGFSEVPIAAPGAPPALGAAP